MLVDYPGMTVIARTGSPPTCELLAVGGEPLGGLCPHCRETVSCDLPEPGRWETKECSLGLTVALMQIEVASSVSALMLCGQVLLAPPDPERFKSIARQQGIDEERFLSALDQVPVLSEDDFNKALDVLAGIARLIGGKGTVSLRMVEDLAELKRTREVVRSQASALEDVLRGADIGTWDWNVKTGDVTFNQYWAGMLGYDLAEIEPNVSAWEELVHPEDMPDVMAKLQAHLEGRTPYYECIHRLKAKDGSWVWVLDKGQVLERDVDGTPLRACGTHLDVTERHASRLALEAAYQELERYRDELKRERDLFIDGPVVCFLWQAREGWPVEYVSANVEKLCGLTPGQFTSGQTAYSSLIHPDDLERVTAEVTAGSSRHQASFTHEDYRIRCAGGEYIWITDHTRVIRDAAGEITHYYGFVYDVTERNLNRQELEQQTQELTYLNEELVATNEELEAQYEALEYATNELTDAEERYRAFVSAVPDILFRISRDGVFKDFAGNEEVLYAPSVEFIGAHISKVLPPQVVEQTERYISEVVASGSTRSFDYTLALPIGEKAFNAVMVPYGEEDVLTIVRDISDRKAAEKAVIESEERLRTLINTMPDIVCFKDGKGRWLIANDYDLELFELVGVDYQGKTDSELAAYSNFYRDAFLGCEATDEVAWQAGRPSRGEETIPRPDGSSLVFDIIKVPTFNPDGSRRGLIVVGRDITEIKAADEQRRLLEDQYRQAQKMEAVGRLAGGVAHDLNNMLMPILGYSDMIADEMPAQSQLAGYAQEIRSAAKRARDLVSRLLAFSRKRDIHLSVVDLNEVLNGLQKLLRRTIRENVELTFNLSGTVLHVHADPNQLEQVLMNLVVNAQDAIPGNGVITITSGAGNLPAALRQRPGHRIDGRCVCFTVADTGKGIPREIIDKIFDPFFTTKSQAEGTGLGLAMAYGIIEHHGGLIDVSSTVDRGTEFRIYLPSSPGGPCESIQRQPVTSELQGSETIVIVEDEPQVRNLVVHALGRYGYQVTCFATPRECVRSLKNKGTQPDLLLTDIILPEFTGVELYRQVRELCPGIKGLFMSGYSQLALTEELQEELQVELLKKPFSAKELASRVRAVLDTAEAN